MKRSPFENAAVLVEDWLDKGTGSNWAKRDRRLRIEQGRAWDIDLQDSTLPIRAVRVVLPPDFPAKPCELYVDRGHFLKVPHIESDGHVCLGLASIPNDYDDPVSAVIRGLTSLKEQLLVPAGDAEWVQNQFQDERASYWFQHALSRRTARDRRPVPKRTRVDVRNLDRWSTGVISAYVPRGSKHRHFALQVASSGAESPHDIATRHGWAEGTRVLGSALFVRLPSDSLWTPQTWPTTFSELDRLVGRLTNYDCSLVSWLQQTGWEDDERPPKGRRKKKGERQADDPPAGQRPLLVVLVQDATMYGYQLFGSAMPLLQLPSIEPVAITRVDPSWSLSRDHQRQVLQVRRHKRVLLIGAGSLGSPLAGLLARAGINHIDILDSQLMAAENTSRHELGMRELDQGKAPALAQRLMQDVPGVTACGYFVDASTWITKNCKPGTYDLVIECTAESSVRSFISHTRAGFFGDAPILHAWIEPFCSAGHVVLSQPETPWPEDDPADELVNASDLAAKDLQIKPPACSSGFHPYGAADIALVAAFSAERIIAVLDEPSQQSMVWSWVRSSAFFESLGLPVQTRAIVPASESKSDSVITTRALVKILAKT